LVLISEFRDSQVEGPKVTKVCQLVVKNHEFDPELLDLQGFARAFLIVAKGCFGGVDDCQCPLGY
jgi:hypothetical protein